MVAGVDYFLFFIHYFRLLGPGWLASLLQHTQAG